jgi:hypothetical protein
MNCISSVYVNTLFIGINLSVGYFVLKINIFLTKYATFCIKYSIIADCIVIAKNIFVHT